MGFFNREYWEPHVFGKRATCAKCGSVYEYFMRRTVSGKLERVDCEDAQARAEAQANDRLDEELEDPYPVPCPVCGRYQRDMVWNVKWNWLLCSLVLGGFLAGFSWLIPTLWVNALDRTVHGQDLKHSVFWKPGGLISLIIAGIGVLVLLVYSPNWVPLRLFRRHVGRLVHTPPAATQCAAQPVQAMSSPPKARVRIVCPRCRSSYRIPAHACGREARCAKCGHVFIAVEEGVGEID